MESHYRCLCGRLWILGRHTPEFIRSGRMVCRCGNTLREDGDGSWHAELIEPIERFDKLRRAGFVVALMLLRMAKSLSIPLGSNSWLRPHRLAHLHSPNRALHARVHVEIRPNA